MPQLPTKNQSSKLTSQKDKVKILLSYLEAAISSDKYPPDLLGLTDALSAILLDPELREVFEDEKHSVSSIINHIFENIFDVRPVST